MPSARARRYPAAQGGAAAGFFVVQAVVAASAAALAVDGAAALGGRGGGGFGCCAEASTSITGRNYGFVKRRRTVPNERGTWVDGKQVRARAKETGLTWLLLPVSSATRKDMAAPPKKPPTCAALPMFGTGARAAGVKASKKMRKH
jgi:hypothetical protein